MAISFIYQNLMVAGRGHRARSLGNRQSFHQQAKNLAAYFFTTAKMKGPKPATPFGPFHASGIPLSPE
jgi:hypothetical protein